MRDNEKNSEFPLVERKDMMRLTIISVFPSGISDSFEVTIATVPSSVFTESLEYIDMLSSSFKL